MSSFDPPLSNAVIHILLSLASGDLHGYGILQEVKRLSGGAYRLGPGTLYANLAPMIDAGLVEVLGEGTEDSRREYRLTSAGADLLGDEVKRLEAVVRAGKKRLGGVKVEGGR